MKKVEIREVTVIYCDWCKEEIKESSLTSVQEQGQEEKHFHSYNKKCINEFTDEQLRKHIEERKQRRQNQS